MILMTHGIVGAALGSLVPGHPVVALAIGFASHFVLDAIPHWDYKLRSRSENTAQPLSEDIKLGKDFIFDLVKIGFDILGGVVIVAALFSSSGRDTFSVLAAGLIGGILPDILQFAYFKLRWRWLRQLQSFHLWIHARKRLFNPRAFGWQALLIVLTVLIILLIRV